MAKIYISILYFCYFILLSGNTYAQYEFYNNGGLIHMNQGSSAAIPTLFVSGNVINQNGVLENNNSFLEVESGNLENNVTTNYYVSTGIERFSGNLNNIIKGTWNGTTLNRNQLYNVKINKNSATGEYIVLDNALVGNRLNINTSGSLVFEGTNGIVRTQNTSSISPYTGDYVNVLYVQNPAVGAISGNSTGVGAITKYIEGKLMREVNASGTYFFPIGVEKTGLDGMEAFAVTMNALSMPTGTTTGLLGYLRPAINPSLTTDLVANGGNLFYDIGGFANPAQNNFSECVGGPDGHDDIAVINQAITHEWNVSPAVVPTSVSYNISFYPGNTLENQINYSIMGAPCSGLYDKAQYIARDGRIGGNTSVGPTINYWVPGVTGYYQSPTMKSLSNQSGFSRFRIFGASDNNTSLPVELIQFFVTPVNNAYFLLNWETASELNNAGFYVQRSTNGVDFENIGWVAGNGTVNNISTYSFTDRGVLPNIRYYYRLLQLDINQDFKYSNILSGMLKGSDFNVVSIQPNPSESSPQAIVYIPSDGILHAAIYDVLGREMSSEFIVLTKGNHQVNLNTSSLSKATYLVRFTFGNETILEKIVKK